MFISPSVFSPSVFSPSCAVWASLFPSLRLCATLSIIAIGQLLSKHCNLAAGCCSSRTSNIPNLLMSGTRPPVVSAPAARSGCFGSRLHRLLGCSAALAALAACPPAPAICLPALAACLHSVRKGKKINLNPLYLIHLEG